MDGEPGFRPGITNVNKEKNKMQMQTVEVFKTNVGEDEPARHLITKLLDHFP